MDLFDFSHKHLRQIRALDPTEFHAFRSASLKLGRYGRWHRSLVAVRSNQAELERTIAGALSVTEAAPTLSTAQDFLSDEANRQLQNFLAAFRFFLDYTNTRLSRTYADAPEVLSAFEAATHSAFDSSFPYRFLYKLRNYAQHCGPPVSHVEVRKDATSPADMTPVFTARLQLDVPGLLEEFADWGPVKTDLLAAEPFIDVGALLEPVWLNLVAIRDAVSAAERPRLLEHAAIIDAMYTPVRDAGGIPVVGVLTPLGGHRFDVVLESPPSEVLDWLGVQHTPIRS